MPIGTNVEGKMVAALRRLGFDKVFDTCLLYTSHRCALAPPFFPQRKGGKKRQGAKPPEPPGGFVDFLSMKIDYDHVA